MTDQTYRIKTNGGYYPMTNFEIISLSLILALIATVVFNFLYKFIYLSIEFHKENYHLLNGFRRQLDNGELTAEEYNRKVREITNNFRKDKKRIKNTQV
jgi:uncharacterized membrane protein